ncbi:LOW QUALITY PROTEIN: hypothetical protein T265_12705, partial [Opisthorchis viverrini]
MTRGQQKIQAQQRNAKKQADLKKSTVDQKKAASKALIYQCTVCKTQMPDPKTYRQHFENKHPKNPLPEELKDVSVNLLTGRSVVRTLHLDFPSRLGQPGSIPAVELPSGGMAARDQKSATAERFLTTDVPEALLLLDDSNKFVTNGLENGHSVERDGSKREYTDRKVRGSNPTSASRLLLSRLEQSDSIPALVPPSGGMTARHRKGVTVERAGVRLCRRGFSRGEHPALSTTWARPYATHTETSVILHVSFRMTQIAPVFPPALGWRHCKKWRLIDVSGVRVVSFFQIVLLNIWRCRHLKMLAIGQHQVPFISSYHCCTAVRSAHSELAQCLEGEFTDRKVRGSNPISAPRVPLSRLGQPGSIPALELPSGGMVPRHREGPTSERFTPLRRCTAFIVFSDLALRRRSL